MVNFQDIENMDQQTHAYEATLKWEGNTGEGTSSYTAYDRSYRAIIPGKPDLNGSADPSFRGDAMKHNPEDLMLTALSACHMLFYLSLCARHRICVVEYQDTIHGRLLIEKNGGGRFESIELQPVVVIQNEDDLELAHQLHATAHELCFIANSCKDIIQVLPEIRVQHT